MTRCTPERHKEEGVTSRASISLMILLPAAGLRTKVGLNSALCWGSNLPMLSILAASQMYMYLRTVVN